jgi:hypothetical protein
MKFFLKFFGGVILLILLVVGFFWMRKEGGILSDKLVKSLDYKPLPTPSGANPNQSTPMVTAVQQRKDYRNIMRATAFANGMELVGFTDLGASVVVQVRWQGDNAAKGGDFLDSLLTQGHMRDFQETGRPEARKDANGRTVYTASFTIFVK